MKNIEFTVLPDSKKASKDINVSFDLSSDFLKSVKQLRIPLSENYYDAFRTRERQTVEMPVDAYLRMKPEDYGSRLCPELPLPGILTPNLKLRVNLNTWDKMATSFLHIGNKGAIAPLHYDWDHRWVAHGCLEGTKRLFFFPAEAGWLLNPIINTSAYALARFSAVDKIEFLSRMGGEEVLLKAGQGVLFPSMFWHAAEYDGPSISLSARFEVVPGGRPFAALPRSWLLQRLLWLFFRDGFSAKSFAFLSDHLDIFFRTYRSWKFRYEATLEHCRKSLESLGQHAGIHGWIGKSFSSELALASRELRPYYDFEPSDLTRMSGSAVEETRQYIFMGTSFEISTTSQERLAAYALHVRQGLIPKRGMIRITREG